MMPSPTRLLLKWLYRSPSMASPTRPTSPSFFYYYYYYCSLSSPLKTAAVPVADLDEGEDNEDPIFTPNPPPSSSRPALALNPTLLQPRVVVYDGVCHLCHRGVKWVINADRYRKIKFCCLQSQTAEPYLRLCGLDRDDVLRRFLFVEGPGLYYQGSAAALRVASYLPLPYSALTALMVVAAPIRDSVYDYVAKRRYDWFGKEKDCLVLREVEMLERFIDREEIVGRIRNEVS
ncbi:hypothetical protein PanWU01x14_308110 [Parasponia andersonii]|uniref:Thiol-disulfide oxidoreductase DCC n=1 Tax=Parasponia andersonii TaxID=3476 RepID=A0A2P5AR27_PARAD|nr:hypothetical protein PanWU01x14_308110 [Parasponia andersonii]